MSTRAEKARIADEEYYTFDVLTKVPPGERPTQRTIIQAKQEMGKILMCISNTIANTGNYGYSFLVYTPPEWLALGNQQLVVPPADVVAYVGAGQADRYAYELQRNTYASYKRHKDAIVRMIIYIFGNDVFLNLQDVHQHLVGHTPLQLLAHLEDRYVTDIQRRDDITAMDAKMRLPYTMVMMIETYFKTMLMCQFTLASLQRPVGGDEMIRLCMVQFKMNDELIESCEKWEDQPPLARTFNDFCNFMIKESIKIGGRKGSLASQNIANLVEDANKQSTEVLSGELLIQAEEIRSLKETLDAMKHMSGSGGVPSMVNTDTSSVMSQQNQAYQVEIATLRAAAAAAAATPTTVVQKKIKKDKRNDNDMVATTAHPYKQRSVRRYTHDNYCHTCGYDIADTHSSANCKWKGANHKDCATITNRMGGTSKNCFHYKGTFAA